MKGRTSDITPHNGLEHDHFSLFNEHSPPLKLILILPDLLRHLVDIRRDDMVRNDILQLLKPERRYLR